MLAGRLGFGVTAVSPDAESRASDMSMSDTDDHQRLLQILEAHGKRFLNSFEQPTKPSSSKRKLEASDDSSNNSEEDEEWHGFGIGNVCSDNLEDIDSINPFHGVSQVIAPHLDSAYERRG